MPELPEVETVAMGLRPLLVGRTILGVRASWPRTIVQPSADEFVRRMAGRSIAEVGRRGKYVVITLDHGLLLIHLKMSGRLTVVPREVPLAAHTHTVFDLENRQQLRFTDTRKFGRLYLVADLEQVTNALGPEPLAPDFTPSDFRHLLVKRSGRLKPLLLNQEFLAGLGNIYADESLFAAQLHPLRLASSLSAEEQDALFAAIRAVLSRAVASRGTTLEDQGYRDALGEPGGFQEFVSVYGRAGKPCRVCGAAIERLVISGRSSHYCPHCQSAAGLNLDGF